MKSSFLFILLIWANLAFAGIPLDIVFDIDQTIVTKLHDTPFGDLLKDPKDPNANVIEINFEEVQLDKNNKVILNSSGTTSTIKVKEKYRVFEEMTSLMEELKKLQDEGKIRLTFFSGGPLERNGVLLKSIKLSDGSSLYDLARGKDKVRIYGRTDMTYTGVEKGRIRDRFKKDLTKVNKNLDDVIIIDDIKEFVPDSQRANMLWIDEKFPYPEKYPKPGDLPPSARMIYREKYKFRWISEYLLSAIDKRLKQNIPLTKIVQQMTSDASKTPFSEGEDVHFENGKKRITSPGILCIQKQFSVLMQLR